MGWPVAHSRSPRLHNFWLSLYGIDGAYVPFAVPPGRVEAAIRALPDLGLAGVNVTVPHKERAFQIVDVRDDVAERIGAVNTVVVESDGQLRGTNTDAFGFLAGLNALAPFWDPVAGPVAVLGAGGASRAILVALQDAGVPELRLVNRTFERAAAVSAELGTAVAAVPWSDRAPALAGVTLLVNTTTLGMAGQPPLDLDLDSLPTSAVVNDIVYVPQTTPLLAAAAVRGNTVVGGLEMLLHQARPGFEAWFGRDPEVTEAVRVFVAEGLV